MASGHSQILKAAIAIAIAGLLALLFPMVILPLLPPLRPLTSQLLLRLRDVFAFLAFTTAIAIGIFSTQRKDTHSHQKKQPFLEHHPLGSIFGEPSYGETEELYTDDRKPTFSPATKRVEASYDGDRGGNVVDYTTGRISSAIQNRSTRPAMAISRMERLTVSKEDNGYLVEPKVQRKLHRKSSSLDDSVNYEPESDAASVGTPDNSPPASNGQDIFGSNKPSKRVSFSMASTTPSSKYDTLDEDTKQSKGESVEKPIDVSGSSPGDLNRQADAFIAKFKEQMRVQRLESFQRYRRRIS
eukprot:c16583_g1_i1 orf=78-974(+)